MIERLKFRGISTGSSVFGVQPEPGKWIFGNGDSENGGANSIAAFWCMVRHGAIDTATVGQWTELKDKNGKEIYEGDIVRCREDDDIDEGTVHTVKYCGDWGYPAFELDPCPIDDSNGLSHYSAVGSVEVIGNIHEEAEGE